MSPLALGDDCRKRKNMGKKVEFKVCGLSAKYFVPLFLVIIICTYGGFMPTVKIGETTGVGMVGTLAFLMSVGGLFFWLGNSIPVVNSYLGGSVLFCMFGPALLNYFGLLPETLSLIHISCTTIIQTLRKKEKIHLFWTPRSQL